jgi:hypothetical protein
MASKKKTNLFIYLFAHVDTTDSSSNFTQATFSPAVSTTMLLPYNDRLHSLNILKIAAMYASCCNQEMSEKYLDKTKRLQFPHSSEPCHESANELRNEKLNFYTHCPCHCRAVKKVLNLKFIP